MRCARVTLVSAQLLHSDRRWRALESVVAAVACLHSCVPNGDEAPQHALAAATNRPDPLRFHTAPAPPLLPPLQSLRPQLHAAEMPRRPTGDGSNEVHANASLLAGACPWSLAHFAPALPLLLAAARGGGTRGRWAPVCLCPQLLLPTRHRRRATQWRENASAASVVPTTTRCEIDDHADSLLLSLIQSREGAARKSGRRAIDAERRSDQTCAVCRKQRRKKMHGSLCAASLLLRLGTGRFHLPLCCDSCAAG